MKHNFQSIQNGRIKSKTIQLKKKLKSTALTYDPDHKMVMTP
jgi:hypothetical protein